MVGVGDAVAGAVILPGIAAVVGVVGVVGAVEKVGDWLDDRLVTCEWAGVMGTGSPGRPTCHATGTAIAIAAATPATVSPRWRRRIAVASRIAAKARSG